MSHTKSLPKKSSKRTYQLSSQTLAKFEAEVPAGKRGAAVDEAIDKWLEEKRLEKIRAAIEEFGRDAQSQALYAQIERVWAPLSDEVWSQIDDDWSKMSAEEMDKEFLGGN